MIAFCSASDFRLKLMEVALMTDRTPPFFSTSKLSRISPIFR